MQNTSSAVMQQRSEPADSLDYFPTPGWATRALCEYVISIDEYDTILEPACGEGHMAKVLGERTNYVVASDIFDYGYGETADFLGDYSMDVKPDWVITNPPYNLGLDFIEKALTMSNKGVAVILRSAFVEGKRRYENLFSVNPPSIVAPFVERVTMVKGRVDRKQGSATSYAWFVWEKEPMWPNTELRWIPPCRAQLEYDRDYK